jgi:hypothetical protein
MNLNRWMAGARLAVAILILAAIGTQFMGSLDDPHKSIVMFWSEFTYQSNLIVAIVLLFGAWFPWNDVHPGPWWGSAQGRDGALHSDDVRCLRIPGQWHQQYAE